MKKVLFATHNDNKVSEVQSLLGDEVQVLSLHDLNDYKEIEENAETLEGNALIKAREAYKRHHITCFADDTGLNVTALNGAPGVYSARYAGPEHDSKANMRKLLHELLGQNNRSAKFTTVIALVQNDGREVIFTGEVLGEILSAPTGEAGFGYDPLFRPKGFDHSFAEMTPEQKNSISHRGRAVAKLADYLKQHPDV